MGVNVTTNVIDYGQHTPRPCPTCGTCPTCGSKTHPWARPTTQPHKYTYSETTPMVTLTHA